MRGLRDYNRTIVADAVITAVSPLRQFPSRCLQVSATEIFHLHPSILTNQQLFHVYVEKIIKSFYSILY